VKLCDVKMNLGMVKQPIYLQSRIPCLGLEDDLDLVLIPAAQKKMGREGSSGAAHLQ
jgi:hypothetical protein